MMTFASGMDTARRLPSTNISPRKSAPASAATKAASELLIPQILTRVVGVEVGACRSFQS